MRSTAEALAHECPQCGAPAGQKCKNYAGRGCAPHADRIHPPEPEPEEPAGPIQGDLFDTTATGGQ